jgi:hypothetical protein
MGNTCPYLKPTMMSSNQHCSESFHLRFLSYAGQVRASLCKLRPDKPLAWMRNEQGPEDGRRTTENVKDDGRTRGPLSYWFADQI